LDFLGYDFLSILFFALKLIVNKLLNKLEKELLRDYETVFCSVLALMVLGKIFKD
jgi:hypothetical protein